MQSDKDVDWVAFECGSRVCGWGGVEKIVSYITRMSLSLGVMSLSLLSSQSLLLTMGLELSYSLLHNPGGGFSGSLM